MCGGAKQVLLKKGRGRLPRSLQPSPDRAERKRGFQRLPAGCWPSAVTLIQSHQARRREVGALPAKRGHSHILSWKILGSAPPRAVCWEDRAPRLPEAGLGSSVWGCTEGTWDAPAPQHCFCAGGRQQGLCRAWRWAGVGCCSSLVQLLWVSFLC